MLIPVILQLPTRDAFLYKLVRTGRLSPEEQLDLLSLEDLDEVQFYERFWGSMHPDVRARFDRYMAIMTRRADVPADSELMPLYRAIATSGYLI